VGEWDVTLSAIEFSTSVDADRGFVTGWLIGRDWIPSDDIVGHGDEFLSD